MSVINKPVTSLALVKSVNLFYLKTVTGLRFQREIN